jgi:hypothetical protein
MARLFKFLGIVGFASVYLFQAAGPCTVSEHGFSVLPTTIISPGTLNSLLAGLGT